MSKLTILDKSAVIRNETQPLANTRGRVADVLEDIANTLVDQDDLNAEATARDQGDAMKLNKPNSDGSYYIAKTTVAGIPYYQYRDINLSSGQIPVSRGSYIGASLLYESVSGRIGLDTQAPSEKFEVYNGRVKADGFILTSSAVSPLPREIKFKGGNFVGAKDDGIEHKFLMGGDLDTELTTKLDKGGYTGTAQDLKNEIDGKLNKPTTTSNTASYPYVVGEDGNGNSARLPAGDLGKNFFNADLSNTTARNHTMNAGVTVKTLGNPHTLSGLPNKNTDIANFRKVRVQNASGLDSVVDSKNLLTDGMTSMTDAEKDAWRLASRKTNETYSTGQPQPFAVFPPIVENSNEIQEVVVVGSNLFLNNQSLGTALVSLVSEDTGTEYPLNVEVNQTNPSVLSFGYNFSTLLLGRYWVKIIHNGLVNINKVYIQVLDTIISNPLPSLSWNGYRQTPNTYFSNTINTTNFVSFTPTGINFTRKYNATSEGNVFINSSAFNLPNDFYLEFIGTCPWQVTNNVGNRQPNISMGLSAYNSTFDVSNTYIAGFGLDSELQNSILFSDTSINLNMGDVTNFVFYVIKRGSKIVLGLKSKSGVLYATYTAPAGNQFMIKLAHFSAFTTTPNTLISFALTKILSL